MARTRRSKPKATVQRKLKRQLKEAPADASVEAVFTLKTPPGQPYLSESSARAVMGRVVNEASAGAKAQPERVTLFPNVQSFAISGPPALVRRVAQHAAVASAMANKQDEDLLIRPVKSSRSKKKR